MESSCLGCTAPRCYRKLLLRYHNSYKVECGGVSKNAFMGSLQIILFLMGEIILATMSSFQVIPCNILLSESEISQTRV